MWGPYLFLGAGLFTFLVAATAATPVCAPTTFPTVFPVDGASDVEREAAYALLPALSIVVARL